MELQQLPQSIQKLIENLEQTDKFTPGKAKRLLEESHISVSDLKQWADFDHPRADSYGRKLIYENDTFELMAMSWNTGDMSAIHDHGYAQWGAVKLFGPAEHSVFRLEDGKMITADRWQCESGDVLAVGHDLIHQMGNTGHKPYMTLHLYGAYEYEKGITADARLYEFDEDRIQFTNGGVFFDLPEGDVHRREEGPETDFATRLRFKVELLRRILTRDNCYETGELKCERSRRLVSELFSDQTWMALDVALDELPNMNSTRAQKQAMILNQEVAAAARLQVELIDNGLVNGSFKVLRNEFAHLAREGNAQDYHEFADEVFLANKYA